MFEDSNKDDDSDDEEDYSPDCESGNEESDEDDISGLVDDSSFVNNNNCKGSTSVSDIIDKMPKARSNTSAVIEGFAKIHVENDDFSTEFRAPFIQYAYIGNDQKYIDINFFGNYFSKEDVQSRNEGWG